MPISGHLLIAGQWQPGVAGQFSAINPATGETLPVPFTKASSAQISQATQAAKAAWLVYRHTTLAQRATFLRACATEIMALGDELLDTMSKETGYPRMRCEGERGRTCGQLCMFADYIEKGDYLDARIDTALPDRQPLPRPDIRYLNQSIGVVAVFAVSNFPLAFSSAGGDTASALAAGCPVIVKGHASHPGTGELAARALGNAALSCGLPAAVISFIQGDRNEAGSALIQAPEVKAIAFTGSFQGGMAISQMAAGRAEPIPVFAEMGSINPLVLLPNILEKSADTVAKGYIGSLTLGTGQFCVNPGLVLAMEGPELQQFINAASSALDDISAGVMLNAATCSSYQHGMDRLGKHPHVEVVGSGKAVDQQAGFFAQAAICKVEAEIFLNDSTLQEEVFGPLALVVVCKNKEQLLEVINSLQGQLTGTVHGTLDELQLHTDLLEALTQKVGRIVINGFPTGVEVCSAMVHGGPFPATTDSRTTSVGTAAIQRFVRPVCYQNYPENLLPEALQNANPLALSRIVNSNRTTGPVQA